MSVVSGTDGHVLVHIEMDQPFYALRGLSDVTGDGLPDFLGTLNPWDEYGGRVYLFGADSLRHSQAPSTDGGPTAGIQLRIRAPAVAGRLAVLLFSLGSEEGMPLGLRKLPIPHEGAYARSGAVRPGHPGKPGSSPAPGRREG
jgi:hypothetical protein